MEDVRIENTETLLRVPMPPGYLHVSKQVFRIPITAAGDPAIILGYKVVVQTKGTTYRNDLERHLKKHNPDMCFDRGVALPLPRDFYHGRALAHALRPIGGRKFREMREEALSA